MTQVCRAVSYDRDVCIKIHDNDCCQPINGLLYQLHVAACYLQTSKLGRSAYQEVVAECDHALNVNPSSIKALYRKGVALFHIRDYSDAIDVLTKASQLSDPLRSSLGTWAEWRE